MAVFAAMLPVLRVVDSGPWLPGAIALTGVILVVGYLGRWLRWAAVAVSLAEALVWMLLVTLFFLRDTALLGLIPTPQTAQAVPQLVGAAFAQIQQESAPLTPTAGLSFFIVGTAGLLAIAVDHVVLTARMPLLAAVGLIAVSLIPSIAVPGAVDVWAFVLLAATILFLLRAEVRSRDVPPAERVRTRSAAQGVGATAVAIGAVAVVVALVAGPALPPPARVGSGLGAGASIDPTLQLGDDLRKPTDVEVLRVRSDSGSAPYLRVATLSEFDGQVWQPDRSRTLPLDSPAALGPVAVDEGIAVTEATATVQVEDLLTSYLPVTSPAVEVSGLSGEWGGVPYNRTVVSRSDSAQGQRYQVVSQQPKPTLQQIRRLGVDRTGAPGETLTLPADLPPVIAESAAQVTAGSTNDYDRLHDLQSWFRGASFRYSLDAPVEDGFDGSGADAVADFLRVKSGYCVHYASAFALMARTLGMPSRIVVGYLPGTATGQSEDGEQVFAVQSGQLHAWPEVLFRGIGWVPFEPTNSLGIPTNFASENLTGGSQSETPQQTAAPTSSPAPTSSLDAGDRQQPDDSQAGSASRSTAPLTGGGIVLGVLLALALPGIVRAMLRARMLRAARRGDAAAAWRVVQDEAIDLGITLPASQSPRVVAARLVAEHGVDAATIGVLVRGIEVASYAPAGTRGPWRADEMADAAASVRAQLLTSVPAVRRVLAAVAPRSLVVRPGRVHGEPERAG